MMTGHHIIKNKVDKMTNKENKGCNILLVPDDGCNTGSR